MSWDSARATAGQHPGAPLAGVLAAVAGLWGLTLILVPPSGEFPLNDGWIFAGAVKTWLETGHYQGHPFAAVNLIGHACWGKCFAALFGFSFEVLRWSTLVLWLLAAWAVALAALLLRARPPAAALAGALVLANPLAMNLGYTFMTDVPFLAATALAGFCYLRALAVPRWEWFFAGSAFGAWALLIRQFGAVLPVALGLAFLPLAFRLGWRAAARLGVAFVLPWAAASGLLQWLPAPAGGFGASTDSAAAGGLAGGLAFYSTAIIYLALFCAPLGVAPAWHWLRDKPGSRAARAAGLAATLLLLAIAACWAPPHRIPFTGNVLYDTGVGPMTLKGNIGSDGTFWRPVSLGAWWWLPTLLGLLGAAWMLAGTARWFVLLPGDGRRPVKEPRRRQQAFLMLWAMLAIAALYHPWLSVRFDRYLLGALVPVLLLVAMAPAGRSRVLPALQIVLFGGLYAFSVLGIQDYMAWNTARWNTVDRLMAEGVPPEAIDAGYEFNGWYTSPHFIEERGPGAFQHSGSLGWWAVEDRWAVSWRPRPGFETVEEILYDSWLAGEKGKLLLLKKEPE